MFDPYEPGEENPSRLPFWVVPVLFPFGLVGGGIVLWLLGVR